MKQIAFDALRQPISVGDTVTFLDGRHAVVTAIDADKIYYRDQRQRGPVCCYAFLVVCESPAAVAASAVVAQAADMQGASLSLSDFAPVIPALLAARSAASGTAVSEARRDAGGAGHDREAAPMVITGITSISSQVAA